MSFYLYVDVNFLKFSKFISLEWEFFLLELNRKKMR